MEKKDTQMVKGLAICLLLFHHLFFTEPPTAGIIIGNQYLANIIAEYLKVCVALFVVLSGYGLNASMNKNQYSIKNFYIRNITKIYKSYWLIWILFVPVGLVRGRAFYKIYGQNYIFKAITDFLGIQKILGYKSYNPTWWFITLILGLYLLFPLIYRLAKKVPILLLISSTAIMFLPNIKTANLNIISTFKDWILPFTFGIIISEYHILEKDCVKLFL